MSTLTVVRKGSVVAIAAESLTTFEDTRLPFDNDMAPEKVFPVETVQGTAYVGVVGYTAHYLVLKQALEDFAASEEGLDLFSREAVFETFRQLHPVLKETYYLLPESGQEGDPYESSQASILIASPGGIFGVYDMREVHAYKRFWAMGSGYPYALGAMWARYDALEAGPLAEAGVEAGIAFDRSSDGPVQVHTVALAPEA
ncbi:MAG: MFS transporter [Bacteroidota bacterium]